MPKKSKKPPRPTPKRPPIAGTAAQKDAARDARLASLEEERLTRLEEDDDERMARAQALRPQ